METAEVPDDQELENQLCSLKYGFDGKSRIQLQSKKDLKSDGYPSPDLADSLSLSFFEDVVIRKAQLKAPHLPSRTRLGLVWTDADS